MDSCSVSWVWIYQSWYHNFGWQINSKNKSVSTAEQLHLRSNLDSWLCRCDFDRLWQRDSSRPASMDMCHACGTEWMIHGQHLKRETSTGKVSFSSVHWVYCAVFAEVRRAALPLFAWRKAKSSILTSVFDHFEFCMQIARLLLLQQFQASLISANERETTALVRSPQPREQVARTSLAVWRNVRGKPDLKDMNEVSKAPKTLELLPWVFPHSSSACLHL